jgi:hypothetical protein
MINFKEFLNEHIVVGDLKKSPTDLYYVSPGRDDKSKLFIYPKIKDMQYDFKMVYTEKGFDVIDEAISLWDKTEKYPYPELKKILMSKSKEIMQNTYLKAEEILDKNLVLEIEKQFNKPENIQRAMESLSSSITYSGFLNNYDSYRDYAKKNTNSYGRIIVTLQSIYKIIVNTNTKSIYPESNPIQLASRIGKIGYDGQSKQTYIIPMSEVSIDSPREIYKILQSLVKKYPELANYSYIDAMSRSQERTLIKDVLDGAGEVGKMNTSYNNMFSRRNSITVYHGTSEKIYNDYIKNSGLQPDKGHHYSDKIMGHSDKNVYFTANIGDARKYAVRASGASSRSMVLEVKITDFDKITFDEDNMYGALRRIPEKIMKEIKVRFYNLYLQNDTIWPFEHTKEHVADVGLDQTEISIHSLKYNLEKNPGNMKLIKPLLDFIGYYAVKGSTFTFAYNGIISPRDIKVKETFKSKAYKDSGGEAGDWETKNFKKKYSGILKSFKSGK